MGDNMKRLQGRTCIHLLGLFIFSQWHSMSSLQSLDVVGRCILPGQAKAGSASGVQNNLRCTQPSATQTKSDGAHWLRSHGLEASGCEATLVSLSAFRRG